MEFMPLIMFVAVCAVLMLGYPVAFTLSGVALIFALIGTMTGQFDGAFLEALPNRLFGIMGNQILIAVPLFVFMGVMLEKSRRYHLRHGHPGTNHSPFYGTDFIGRCVIQRVSASPIKDGDF